jgi:hypothetical protein
MATSSRSGRGDITVAANNFGKDVYANALVERTPGDGSRVTVLTSLGTWRSVRPKMQGWAAGKPGDC